MNNRCNECGEVEGTHAANCIRIRERSYKSPIPWWKQPKKPTAEMEHTFHPLRRNETKDKPI